MVNRLLRCLPKATFRVTILHYPQITSFPEYYRMTGIYSILIEFIIHP